MPNSLFLGVDGGQSSTTALIADANGHILGRGIGGPCNHASAEAGRRKFISAVTDCLQQACVQAGLDANSVHFTAVCFGLSGGAEDKSALIHELIRSDAYHLTHDGEIALTGATGGAPGIIVIAGTGSFAFGRNAAGTTARSGGWGYIYGDEGGAFDLVRRALRAALRYEEGWGPETELRQALLQESGAATADDLLHRFYADVPRSTVAAYAPLVARVAEQGDSIATGILDEAAVELYRYVSGVSSQLFARGDEPKVSYTGGVFQSEILKSRLTKLVGTNLSSDIGPPLYRPVFGALLEAFRKAGLRLVSEVLVNVGETAS